MGKLEMMSWTPLVILSSFLFLQALSAEAESDSGASRKPKLFYVSTQVNTFTFTTNSVCVLSTTTALVACPTQQQTTTNNNNQQQPTTTPILTTKPLPPPTATTKTTSQT